MKRLLPVLLLACGCDSATQQVSTSLQPLNSCEDVTRTVKDRLIASMEQQVDQSRRQQLEWGRNCNWQYDSVAYAGMAEGGRSAPPSGSSGITNTSGGATSYSTTNNQVVGVDEADFIKNDARYFYVAADGALQVFDAFPPESAHRIARLPLDGDPYKLFVADGRAVVFAHKGGPYAYRACTYGYDCELQGEPGPTLVHFVDLTDLAAPVKTRSFEFGGGLLAARRVGRVIYASVGFADATVPGLQTWPDNLTYCYDDSTYLQVLAAWSGLKAKNRKLIEEADVSALLPVAFDQTDGRSFVESCGHFYAAGSGASTTSLFAFDLTGEGEVGSASIVSRPGAVFANERSLYLAARVTGDAYGDTSDETSSVHRFALDGVHVAYAGSAAIDGHVLNQFAMDEFDGHLRVATSVGHVPSPGVHSVVTVLDATGAGLTQSGKIDGIAPTEDIRSVRFVGERGYLVTFKKTDPLFTLDLADPKAPRVMGELKIPGFSTYMHPVGKDHLLAIGFDAEDHGTFAFFQGLQLQFFDVADPTHPQLLHKELIGTRGSASAATSDHLAFNYFNDSLLGLPMAICEDSSGGSSYGRLTFDGLLVYRATLADGFTRLGGIANQPAETQELYDSRPYYDSACYQWWSSSTTHVQRSVFMDDAVYSVAPDVIRAQRLGNLGTDLAVLKLTE